MTPVTDIRTIFANIFTDIFAPTTASAIRALDRAIAKLDKAELAHSKEVERLDYIAEQAKAEADLNPRAAERASRIRNKLADLIG